MATKSTWRRPVHDENRSKTICANKESTAQQQHRLLPTTADRKEFLSQGEVLQRHRELAAQYGYQADRVVAHARQHGHRDAGGKAQAQSAVTWARDHVFERSAVQDRRAILETAIARSMGETTYSNIQQEFDRRINTGEFQDFSPVGARRQYTTRAMAGMEREIVDRMLEGTDAITEIQCSFRPRSVSPPKTVTRN